MDAELKKKWVEALRSGKYEQTRAELYLDGGYCCLGVLLDQTAMCPSTWHGGGTLGCVGGPDKFGLSEVQEDELVHMNDAGRSFPEIADWIEKNL